MRTRRPSAPAGSSSCSQSAASSGTRWRKRQAIACTRIRKSSSGWMCSRMRWLTRRASLAMPRLSKATRVSRPKPGASRGAPSASAARSRAWSQGAEQRAAVAAQGAEGVGVAQGVVVGDQPLAGGLGCAVEARQDGVGGAEDPVRQRALLLLEVQHRRVDEGLDDLLGVVDVHPQRPPRRLDAEVALEHRELVEGASLLRGEALQGGLHHRPHGGVAVGAVPLAGAQRPTRGDGPRGRRRSVGAGGRARRRGSPSSWSSICMSSPSSIPAALPRDVPEQALGIGPRQGGTCGRTPAAAGGAPGR